MDAFSEIAVFTRVVDLGGFTRAAEALALPPSGVSRIISRLEARLGVRLLHRTTRSLSLTDDGATYYQRCTRILAELAEADGALARASQTPQGRLRVDVPIALADFVIGPAMPGFLRRYPELSVELTVQDRLIDPAAEGVDVVVRLAPSRDSELVARRLAPARSLLVASPEYLKRVGRPRTLEELKDHTCLTYLSRNGPLPWRFHSLRGEVEFAAKGRLVAGSGNLLTHGALGGLGLAQTYEYHVAEHLAAGRLETVLESHEPEPRMVHALYTRQKVALPKVKVFVEFLTQLFTPAPKRR
jgi:DNA-binding transcriptional LysR family regulator